MEITIKINGRDVTVEVSAEVAEYLDAGERKSENLSHEKRRHWDDREFDEYIIAVEGRLPYSASPEEQVCQKETWDEIMTMLALCTDTQRKRFLLHALYDLSYTEVGRLCGCSKYAVRDSIEAVRKIFQTFFKNRPHDCPLTGL